MSRVGKTVLPQDFIDAYAGEWSRQNVAIVFGAISLISAVTLLLFFAIIILISKKDFSAKQLILTYLWIGFSLYGPFWLLSYIGTYFPEMRQTPWLIWLIEMIDFFFLRIFGPIFWVPLSMGVACVVYAVFYLFYRSIILLIRFGKSLKRNLEKKREDLEAVRKWINFCKYPKWAGFLVGVVGTILAIYQSSNGGWLAASGVVLGGASELAKKRLQKWESELLSQENLVTDIELGVINNQNTTIPTTSSNNLRFKTIFSLSPPLKRYSIFSVMVSNQH